MEFRRKAELLDGILKQAGSCVVAFSGGVDSSYLAAAAKKALGDNAHIIMVISPLTPKRDVESARAVAAALGFEFETVQSRELDDETFAKNPPDRCYHCKKHIFGALIEAAQRLGAACVVEGTNRDDETDYRPGMRAIKEMSVRSPLKEAGFTKAEIRAASKEMGVPTWNKPSSACLASRFPYGSPITEEKARRADDAEERLTALGYSQVRVRDFGFAAVAEIAADELGRAFDEREREKILAALKAAGYKKAAIDLEGYKTGSMNAGLADELKNSIKTI